MGSVDLAEQVVIGKKFALTVLAPEFSRRADLVARFLQEARSASRIGHENVIDIMDFGQSPDGLVYIAMEFLDGKDLGEIVRGKGALEWSEARAIVLQICRALRAAHDKGIGHRDMKPENIFLIQCVGQPHFVKILDFGIAKVMGLDPSGPRLTRTGMIFGTREYMAPEQAEGKDTDHRADIYAVGCIMYHLILPSRMASHPATTRAVGRDSPAGRDRGETGAAAYPRGAQAVPQALIRSTWVRPHFLSPTADTWRTFA